MATRSNNRNRFFIRLGRDMEFKLSASEWSELRSGGWIEPIAPGSRYADLKRGIVGWIRGGDLHLLALARMQSVTASWLRAWIYKMGTISAKHVGETVSDRQERLMLEQERERQNEALLWRTFRNTKGANEFSWIAADTKAEILRALKPEMKEPAEVSGL